MAEQIRKSWLRHRFEEGLRRGFQHAYETVKVDPAKFLLQLRAAYGLPITSFHGVYSVEMTHLDDVAGGIIRSGMKMAAAEGAGLGLGGILTVVPDLSILAGITLRTIQKLSLLYGFEFNTAAGERSSEPLRAPCHPAHCRAGQWGSSGEVVGTPDSCRQLSDRRRAELLLRARLG